jgi:hypothetical protein
VPSCLHLAIDVIIRVKSCAYQHEKSIQRLRRVKLLPGNVHIELLSDTERTKAAHEDAQSRVDIFANKDSQSMSHNAQPRNSRQSLITEEHEISVAPAQVLLDYTIYSPTKRGPWEFQVTRGSTNLFPLFSSRVTATPAQSSP